MTTLTNTPEASATDQETGAYPESTLSLRLDVDGIGLSWTLRGTDESMARRLPRVLSYLKRLQAKLPTPETPRPVAVPSALWRSGRIGARFTARRCFNKPIAVARGIPTRPSRVGARASQNALENAHRDTSTGARAPFWRRRWTPMLPCNACRPTA